MSENQSQKTKKKNLNALVPVASIDLEKEAFLVKLKDCLGLPNLAIEQSKIDKNKVTEWLKDDFFSEKFKDATEYAGDVVERMLFKKITEGDTQAITFYCETKLRSRGYYKKS